VTSSIESTLKSTCDIFHRVHSGVYFERAHVTSSVETLRRTFMSMSIRPCSTSSSRELPSRQQMALSSLAEGGGTPGNTKREIKNKPTAHKISDKYRSLGTRHSIQMQNRLFLPSSSDQSYGSLNPVNKKSYIITLQAIPH
jgi:hypothetical protein